MPSINDIAGETYKVIKTRLDSLVVNGVTIPVTIGYGGILNSNVWVNIDQVQQAPSSNKIRSGYYLTFVVEVIVVGANYELLSDVTNEVLGYIYDDSQLTIVDRMAYIITEPTINELIEDGEGIMLMRKIIRIGMYVI